MTEVYHLITGNEEATEKLRRIVREGLYASTRSRRFNKPTIFARPFRLPQEDVWVSFDGGEALVGNHRLEGNKGYKMQVMTLEEYMKRVQNPNMSYLEFISSLPPDGYLPEVLVQRKTIPPEELLRCSDGKQVYTVNEFKKKI